MSDPTADTFQTRTVTPHLICGDAAAAIEFYRCAFGAIERFRLPGPKGKGIMHACVQIGDSPVYLADENPQWGSCSPKSLKGTPVTIHLRADNVDELFAQAIAAGGTPMMSPADMFWGARYGVLLDPFGHQWSIATDTKKLTPEQIKENAKALFDGPDGGAAGTAADGREIVSARLFAAPRERVFDAFADPRQLERWWGPRGFTNTFERFDFHPGGQWHFTMHSPEGADFHNVSEFTDVSRPERIVFEHSRPVHRFRMTMRFEEAKGGTRLIWTMTFPTAEEVGENGGFIREKNEENFDRLAELLSDTSHPSHHQPEIRE